MALGLLGGSRAMFGMIYEKYHHALYLNVIKLIRDPVETQDIVQDTFLALWTKRQEIDVEKSIGGWLFTVSYHRSIDLLKKSSGSQPARSWSQTIWTSWAAHCPNPNGTWLKKRSTICHPKRSGSSNCVNWSKDPTRKPPPHSASRNTRSTNT